MNIILITSLSLLAGIAMAGSVWYVWGLVENIRTFRVVKAIEAENRRLELEAEEGEEDLEDSV
jgi:hypothetical protein